MKNYTVFCGSNLGTNGLFEKEAYQLGQTLANHKIGVIYGGAKIGLMGAVAKGALDNNGKVIGVLPKFLQQKEVAHPNLTELILVETMHERKTKMNDLSDGVIALPGGFGTIEELFEILTWAQLGLHTKPIALLNIAGFYNPLIYLLDGMVKNGFLKQVNQKRLLIDNDINDLIDKMKTFVAPTVEKWITKMTT